MYLPLLTTLLLLLSTLVSTHSLLAAHDLTKRDAASDARREFNARNTTCHSHLYSDSRTGAEDRPAYCDLPDSGVDLSGWTSAPAANGSVGGVNASGPLAGVDRGAGVRSEGGTGLAAAVVVGFVVGVALLM